MKKLAYILAAAMVLLSGCKKEEASEVGKWYAYNTADSKDDVAVVLDLQAGNKVDLIITAWGNRWQGTYTYDGKTVEVKWDKFMGRPSATDDYWVRKDIDRIPVAPENIYFGWSEPLDTSLEDVAADANRFGSTISIEFTYEGDKGTLSFANKDYPAERQ